MPVPPFADARAVRSWMQEIEDRLTKLEGRRDVVVGGWVLEERDGQVEARHVASGEVVVLAAASQ